MLVVNEAEVAEILEFELLLRSSLKIQIVEDITKGAPIGIELGHASPHSTGNMTF